MSYSQTIQHKIDSLYLASEKVSDLETNTIILTELADAYLSVNIDSALTIFNRARSNARKLKNEKLEFQSVMGLAQAYSNLSKLDSSQVFIDVATQLIDENDTYDQKTTLWMNQGILYFRKSEYEKAIIEFEKVLELALVEDHKLDLSRCYNNIALCYSYTARYEESLKMHIESAKLAEEMQDPTSLAKSYNNMGLVYYNLEEYEKSEEYLLKSLDIKRQEGDDKGVISSYLNLGNTFRKLGIKLLQTEKLDKARSYYTSALSLSERANYVIGINNSYINLALIETTTENFDKGIEYGKLAVAFSKKAGNFHSEMVSTINLGDTYRFKKEYKNAEEQLLLGLAMASEINNLGIKKEVLVMLSRLQDDKKDYKKSLEYYRQFVALKDSIGSTDVKNRVNELETKYETEKKEKEILQQRTQIAEKELEVKQKNSIIYGSLGLALILGLLGYLFYNQQKLKNRQLQKESELTAALARIETQNRLQEQRLRISRDLHDNIGSQLTFIISSVDNLKFKLDDSESDVTQRLSTISQFTGQTIYELRDTIWAMNKNEITIEDLQSRISNFIEKAGAANDGIAFQFSISEAIANDTKYTSVRGMNMYRIIQESVNNALKHAQASQITVHIDAKEDQNFITIEDNGKGFDMNAFDPGNGLTNIQKRAKEMGGQAEITSVLEKGTKVFVYYAS